MRQLNRGGVQVTHYDTDYLARGTHKLPEVDKGLFETNDLDIVMLSEGYTSPTRTTDCMLYDPGNDFRGNGIKAGQAILNDTDGSAGVITSVGEDFIYCTLTGGTRDNWAYGDQYSIYITAAYGTRISTYWTDRRFGRKVTGKDTLLNGLFPDDVDLDEYEENVWGPGQPSRT